jgi:enoyl-CoA hydratase/carnithine racemase
MTGYDTLIYETDGPVGIIALNRPQRLNAVNETMIEELEDFLKQRQNDLQTRVLVLAGAGEKGFCAGLDTKETLPRYLEMGFETFYCSQHRISRLITAMRRIPQPIVAAVHGAAAGLGFSLAMGADLRVVTADARFIASYINIGTGGADMAASYLLPRLIGSGRAYEFLLTGNAMDAQTALAVGLVSRVVERAALRETALDLARTMAAKNPLGLRLTKEAINVNIDAPGLEAAQNLEDRNQAMCFGINKYEGKFLNQ